MIARYSRPEMAAIWEDRNRYRVWLQVELAVCEELKEEGLISPEDTSELRKKVDDLLKKGGVDPKRVDELEAITRHDVIAFTMSVGETIGDPNAARWLHYGMTSNDVVDTAQALQLRDASQIIERDLVMFGEVLDVRAHEFQHTPQIGRTHGVHAEPITFGLKIANWFAADTLDDEKAAAGRINEAALNEVMCAPLGWYLRYYAWTKELAGVTQGPLPFFWGVGKTV